MKLIIFVISFAVILQVFLNVFANDFPSLLVANATIAILLDHEYLDIHYGETLKVVKEHVERILREDLKEGGLNVKYFSWTQINFNKDFTAVISITNCKNSWNAFYKSKQETLVYIALTEPDCPRFPLNEGILIPLVAVGEELPQILLDIRGSNSVSWKNAVILYDDILDRDTISRVVKSLSSEIFDKDSSAIPISMFKIINNLQAKPSEIKEKLANIPTSYVGKNFIVFVSNPKVVLSLAGEIGMIDATSQWLFLLSETNQKSYNISVLNENVVEGGNVAIAINRTSNEYCKIQQLCFFGEIFKHFVYGLMHMIREEGLIYGQISDEEWESIRLTKLERKIGILDYIKNQFRNNPNCSSCSNWILQSIETWGVRFLPNKVNTDKSFTPIINSVGKWEPVNGLITNDSIFPHITHGFRNKSLPVAIYHNPPWQIITYDKYGKIQSMDGIIIHVLNELAEKLNFTYVIKDIRSDFTNFQNEDELLNVTGYYTRYESTLKMPDDVLELVVANKVLFAAVGVTVNEQYASYFNFSMPISEQLYSFLIARPKELSKLYLFAAPFSTDTWLCLGFVLVIIGPILCAINYYSQYNHYYNLIRKGGMFKIGNCFWYIYGALLQQGGMYLPKSDSGRLIIGAWWLVVLVIVTTYCGNLVAFLTFPKIETPISSILQLLNNEKGITWGIKTETYLEKYIKESDDENYKKLLKGAMLYAHETSEIIENVRRGKHVYIDWKINLQYILKRDFLQTDRCDLGLASEEFLSEKIAMMIPLNSPYIEIINKEIYKLLQMGFIEKWLKEYLPKKDRCFNMGQSLDIENHTVNLYDMQGCFLVLLSGFAGAFCLIIFECCFNNRHLLYKTKYIKPFSE